MIWRQHDRTLLRCSTEISKTTNFLLTNAELIASKKLSSSSCRSSSACWWLVDQTSELAVSDNCTADTYTMSEFQVPLHTDAFSIWPLSDIMMGQWNKSIKSDIIYKLNKHWSSAHRKHCNGSGGEEPLPGHVIFCGLKNRNDRQMKEMLKDIITVGRKTWISTVYFDIICSKIITIGYSLHASVRSANIQLIKHIKKSLWLNLVFPLDPLA